jgi:opacity protein-like surface antigen
MLLASAALIAFVLATPVTAQAQFFVSAGAAFPSGDDMDGVDTGFQIAGGYLFSLGEDGLWAAVDGTWGSHGTDGSENLKVYSGMGVLGYSVPTEGNFDPFVWAGGGIMGISSDGESESGFGWQAGAGASLGNPDSNVRPYVEGRYQSASIDISGIGDISVNLFSVHVGVSIGAGN